MSLLEYVCHSVDGQLYGQFGSADSSVLYTDCVLWLSVCFTVLTFNLLFQYVRHSVDCQLYLL